jgi:type IV pilus assembly protein PilN
MININLLPWREEKIERQKRLFIIFLAGCCGLAACIIIALHSILAYKIATQNAINEGLKFKIKALDQKIAEIETLQKEKSNLLARLAVIQQWQKDKSQMIQLFDTVARVVPEGLYLTSLSRTGVHLLLEGKAKSNAQISELMRNIETSDEINQPVLNLIQGTNPEIGFYLQAIQRA